MPYPFEGPNANGQGAQPPSGGPVPPRYAARPAPARAPRSPLRAVEVCLMAISIVIVALLALLLAAVVFLGGSVGTLFTSAAVGTTPPANSFSIIKVEGDILSSSTSYNHQATLDHIKALEENEGNKGILLYMNTNGGGLYESDELYRALMDYKETTGRPVQAYMANVCASGGYYACMAADTLTANYNSVTGSIGVYIALTDTSELYEKLGIRTAMIRSGENKAPGTPGVEITPEQEAVYQSSVDESYERFVGLVAEGRGMDLKTAKKLSDGRIYTARQALDNGLIDKMDEWDSVLAAFEEQTGANAFTPSLGGTTAISDLLSSVGEVMPKSEAETALAAAAALPTGVPLAWAPGLAEMG